MTNDPRTCGHLRAVGCTRPGSCLCGQPRVEALRRTALTNDDGVTAGPSFDCTRQDLFWVRKIVDRAMALYSRAGVQIDRMSIHMDIVACHGNGCPLLLEDFANADDVNFAHDVGGIYRHLNRTTGLLEDYFMPRYADREALRARAA